MTQRSMLWAYAASLLYNAPVVIGGNSIYTTFFLAAVLAFIVPMLQ